MARRSKSGRRLHGILLLDKATGSSSNHELQRVKRLFNAQKAGHTGSLDPLATGMLPVCFGEATRISAFLLDADKTYQTNARLGVRTDSGDADGRIIETRALPGGLSQADIDALLQRFVGEQDQIPPMHSAVQIDGQRLYKLARKGISVDRPARRIRVFSIDCLAWQSDLLCLRIKCSKGTYIRTLVEDIGDALGCGAHVQTLRRLSVSPFESHPMVTRETLESQLQHGDPADLDSHLLAADSALQSLQRVVLDHIAARAFCQGQTVEVDLQGRDPLSADTPAAALSPQSRAAGQSPGQSAAYIRVYGAGQLLGIATAATAGAAGGLIKPCRVFNW